MSVRRALIAPSILAADFARLGDEVRAVEAAGADWIHVDVMDGRFVPNISIGPAIVTAVRKATTLPLDVHLMIVEPEHYIDDFALAGASTIGVHAEACPHLHRTLAQIRETGVRAAVAINPSTPASAVHEVIDCVDQVLVMTVNPGFGGQKFIESMTAKIATIRGWIDASGRDITLEVDGGVGPKTIGLAARAGADVFVAGTSIFAECDYGAAIDDLKRSAGV